MTVSYALLLEVMVEVGNIDMISEVMVHVERYHIPYVSVYLPVSFSFSVSIPVFVFVFVPLSLSVFFE